MTSGQRSDEWAIRTVARDAILQHLLVRHFGYTYGDASRDAALDELNSALERWIANGLGVGIGGGEDCFDPVEVLNFAVAAGFAGDDPFWEEHIVRSARGHIRLLHGLDPAGDDVPDKAEVPVTWLRARLERTYDCSQAAGGSAIRLRFPAPLGHCELSNLRLSGLGAEAGKLDRERLLARFPAGHGGLATIGADILIRSAGLADAPAALDDRERALYLKPGEGLIRVDANIDALAAEVASGKDDDLDKARSIFDFIVNRFRFGSIAYHAVDPERIIGWSMETGFIDCQIGAALFCSMCRSAGIPARMLSGYLLYRHDLALHYWAEVWQEDRGWVPFDLIAWQMSRGGRDAQWLSLFAGGIDPRITTEVLPLQFTGASSVRLPPEWHTLSRRDGEWYETIFLDARSGGLIYRDRVSLI